MPKNILSTFRTIGALAPSSRILADVMTRFVQKDIAELQILEVGAGTGSITKTMVEKMGPGHRVDIVELMPSFAGILQKRFGKNPQVNIHCSNILQFDTNKKYDLIICGLPFNAFPPALTRSVIDHLVALTHSGSVLSFFEYRGIQKILPYILSRPLREDFYKSRKELSEFIERYQFEEVWVRFNLPPALVHFLRF